MEDKKNLNMNDFINAINKKIENEQNFKDDLNKAVENALPKDEKYFKDLDEFVNFLPKTLKNYFTKEKIKLILEKDWKDSEIEEIEEKDLEELYKINLEDKTKLAIIKKFNLDTIKAKKLSVTDDINQAISTFTKILGKVKVSISDFYNFIDNNIAYSEMLLSEDLDDILDCVASNGEKDKFNGAKFWNMCYKFKEQPSEKLINFMVQNTDFTISIEGLMFTIIILMRKHSAYLKDNTKENIFNALNDILNGNQPYQKFSEALLNVPDIADRIKLEYIIQNSIDEDVLDFVADLISNGIEIKLEGGSGNKKFVVDGNKVYLNDELVKFLSQERCLNEWLQAIFSGSQKSFDTIYNDKNDKNKDKAKENLIQGNMGAKVQKVETLGELIQKMSKANAIKNFIEKSKEANRLKKIYGNLLDEDLNKITLPANTVKWCLDGLSFVIFEASLVFDEEDMNNIKDLLGCWGGNSEGKEIFLKQLLFAWKDDKKQHNKHSAISYMSSNNMLPIEKGFMKGYQLCNLLFDTPDGQVSIEFIKHIGSKGSVDFAKLVNDNDQCFGRCLFKTIYALIRTSKNYDSEDPEKQKQAIKNVLVNGENYRWFRDGLKTFFQNAKDKNSKSAKEMNMEDILQEIPEFKKMLENCGMELKFEYNQDQPENSTLKVEEEKIMEIKPGENEKEENEKNDMEEKDITEEALSNLASDKDLPDFIALYDYTKVTTLKGLKQNVLGAFIKSNQERTDKYKSLQNNNLEKVELPVYVIDELLFRFPSHRIQIEDSEDLENLLSENQNNVFNQGLNELKKLYGDNDVSSAGALYFIAACRKGSLTIEQQNQILELHSKKQLGEENKIIEDDKENIKDGSKSSPRPTFSKALAALESIEDNKPITFRLIDFICDNIDFSELKDNDAQEIDNFYGIVYHLIAHNDMVSKFINIKNSNKMIENNELESIRELAVKRIKTVFSETSNEYPNQEAPYKKFWQEIKKSGKSFLTLLSNETIQTNSKNEGNVYAEKLNNLLNTLNVRIEIEKDKISVESVQEPAKEKVNEEQNSNYKEQNLNTDEHGGASIKFRIETEEDKIPVKSVQEPVKEEGHEGTNELDNAVPQGDNNGNTKKSKFPKWASVLIKVLIALAILAVAVLALLFGSGVLGTVFGIAAVGTAKTVAWVIAVVAIFAELIYLAFLSSMSKSNDGPGGGGRDYINLNSNLDFHQNKGNTKDNTISEISVPIQENVANNNIINNKSDQYPKENP